MMGCGEQPTFVVAVLVFGCSPGRKRMAQGASTAGRFSNIKFSGRRRWARSASLLQFDMSCQENRNSKKKSFMNLHIGCCRWPFLYIAINCLLTWNADYPQPFRDYELRHSRAIRSMICCESVGQVHTILHPWLGVGATMTFWKSWRRGMPASHWPPHVR